MIEEVGVDFFTSHDHETTLTNVAAGRGVCLAPGFLDDHNGEFAWTLFDCEERIPCVLLSHADGGSRDAEDFAETQAVTQQITQLQHSDNTKKNKENKEKMNKSV